MDRKVQRIGERERAYVLEVLDAQFRTSAGSMMTRRLEETFAQVFGVGYAISFINGTATMHAALAAAGVGPGDEVIVPPLTMASTSFAVLHAGATPVFADVHPDMWTIMETASRHNLTVIEDAAECFLGHYKGRVVGTIGHAGSFSFQSSKHMTSGEGGMITTDDEAYADRIRRFGSLGYAAVRAGAGKGKITRAMIQDPNYERHVGAGWNYRLPELCSAVALGQLERLPDLIARRVECAWLYAEAARGCSWLIPQAVPEGYVHSYWTYVLRLADGAQPTWYDFRRKYGELGGDGIYAAWQLTYLEPAFRCDPEAAESGSGGQRYASGLCPVAESLQPRLLQFKTNYMDLDVAERKAEALARTIDYFGR
jgi:perosamine synthetase